MRIKRVAPAAALLVLLAACGGQAGQSYGSSGGSSAGSGQSSSQSGGQANSQANSGGGAYGYGGGGSSGSSSGSGGSAGAAAASGMISLASTSLGQVLVGPDGRTLYVFDPDTQSGNSTCYDKCAAAWPPLELNGKPSVGQGLDVSKFGETQRKDGSMQVTYNKWPLYYFAKDAKAGDVNGEGVGGIWWAINSSGDRVQK
jgi:predicted lipoprotein with Yx(FWY)xxD motif